MKPVEKPCLTTDGRQAMFAATKYKLWNDIFLPIHVSDIDTKTTQIITEVGEKNMVKFGGLIQKGQKIDIFLVWINLHQSLTTSKL